MGQTISSGSRPDSTSGPEWWIVLPAYAMYFMMLLFCVSGMVFVRNYQIGWCCKPKHSQLESDMPLSHSTTSINTINTVA